MCAIKRDKEKKEMESRQREKRRWGEHVRERE
jgi:hypothetical protein